ncbi:hypothetical protein ACJMK2_012940, partial [Sinanodonta woodiana]
PSSIASNIRMKSLYYGMTNGIQIRGRQIAMDPVDERFMFLCSSRCGFPTVSDNWFDLVFRGLLYAGQ